MSNFDDLRDMSLSSINDLFHSKKPIFSGKQAGREYLDMLTGPVTGLSYNFINDKLYMINYMWKTMKII